MRLKVSGDKSEIRQSYIPALFPHIVKPLIDVGVVRFFFTPSLYLLIILKLLRVLSVMSLSAWMSITYQRKIGIQSWNLALMIKRIRLSPRIYQLLRRLH